MASNMHVDDADTSMNLYSKPIQGNLLAQSNTSNSSGNAMYLRQLDGATVLAKHGNNQETLIQGMYGTFVVQPDGDYTYQIDHSNQAVAALTLGQTLQEKVSFKVSDGLGHTDFGYFAINIDDSGPNHRPVAFDDFKSVGIGSSVSGNVLLNDTDLDPSTTLEVGSANTAASPQTFQHIPTDSKQSSVLLHGSYGDLMISRDGNFTYNETSTSVPVGGTDVFAYKAIDGSALNNTDVAYLKISVGNNLV